MQQSPVTDLQRSGLSDRLRFLARKIEELEEHLWRLRAGQGVTAVENKAGHAVDTDVAGLSVFGPDRIGILAAGKIALHGCFLETRCNSDFSQNSLVTNIPAIREVGLKQAFDHRILTGRCARHSGSGGGNRQCWVCG